MTKDVPWFKHDADASSDSKLKVLRRVYGWEGMGWYWHIIGILRSDEQYLHPYNDITFTSLAEDFKVDDDRVKQFIDECIEKFNLFKKDGDYFYSERLMRDMKEKDEKREIFSRAGRMGAQKRYGLDEAVTESELPAPVTETEQKMHPYPDLANISMNENEHKKLVEKFGDHGTRERCEKLSEYKASKGKRYASDYHTILTWERMDKKDEKSGKDRRSSKKLPQKYTPPEAI